MKKLIRNLLAALTVCSWAVSPVFAQAPSGAFDLVFDAPESAVYDLTGVHTMEQDIIGAGGEPVPLRYGLPLTHYASGALRGEGNIMVAIGSDVVAAMCVAKGNITGGGEKPTQILLNVTLRGEDVIGGRMTQFQIKLKYKLFVDSVAGEIYGTVKGSANLKGVGNMKIASDAMLPLPANVNGTWSLHVDITPLAKLIGSGTVTLSNGRVLPVHLTGKYKSSTDISTVELRSTGEERGSAFRMVFNLSEGLLDLSGAILGQRLSEPLGF